MKYSITHIDQSGVVVDIYLSEDDIRTHKLAHVNTTDKDQMIADIEAEVLNIVSELHRLDPSVNPQVAKLLDANMEIKTVDKTPVFKRLLRVFK